MHMWLSAYWIIGVITAVLFYNFNRFTFEKEWRERFVHERLSISILLITSILIWPLLMFAFICVIVATNINVKER